METVACQEWCLSKVNLDLTYYLPPTKTVATGGYFQDIGNIPIQTQKAPLNEELSELFFFFNSEKIILNYFKD